MRKLLRTRPTPTIGWTALLIDAGLVGELHLARTIGWIDPLAL
jgi:hypothetical protein